MKSGKGVIPVGSTFTGLSIATRGLYSSQGGLLVTSNNISNINTDGYSRQVVKQSAVVNSTQSSKGVVNGGGSQVTSVDRVRNTSLDQKYWRANLSAGEWEVKNNTLSEIESILSDTSNSDGLTNLLENFYDSMEDLAKDPSSTSVRTVVKQSANTICDYLNDVSTQLTQLREGLNTEVKTVTDEINMYARQIADLNARIREASLSGASTNELEDQRTVMIDNLSKLTKIEVTEVVSGKSSNGMEVKSLSIIVDGNALVSDDKARQLECYTITDGSARNGMYGIRWNDTGNSFSPGGGELQSYLEMRDSDGSGSNTKGVPYYLNQLDEFARTFAKAFNEGVYRDGVTYYSGHSGGSGTDGSTGIRFFSYNGCSSDELMASGADIDEIYSHITAANLSISQDIEADVGKIAASSLSGASGNNENINDLISICKDAKMFDKGTPEDFLSSIISNVGSDTSFAEELLENYSKIVKTINDRRLSVSGVSLDEETANLAKYQQIYNASAKMVSVWSEIFEETINLIS